MTHAFSLRAETSFYWVPYHNMVLQSTVHSSTNVSENMASDTLALQPSIALLSCRLRGLGVQLLAGPDGLQRAYHNHLNKQGERVSD